MPHRWRWPWLLLSSCYFYMAFIPIYILILLLTILIDYFAALFIESATGLPAERGLTVSIAATCLVLFFFKYYDFIMSNINRSLRVQGARGSWQRRPDPAYRLVVSHLSELAYVIEVYRGQQRAERHFGIYALYVMFFPQLVAGPIERPQNLLHQFCERINSNTTACAMACA